MTPSPALLERFLVYLCDEVGVTPDTANQYLSHVTRGAVHWGLVDTSAELRSEGVRLVLAGLRQEQALVAQPRRDSSRIPFTWDMFLLLDGGVLSRLPLIRRVALRAAFAVGFGASLRPGEYLPQPDQQFDPRKHVCVENVAVWYGEVAYPLCSDEVLLGSERATSLHIHLSYRKNDAFGSSGAFVIPANPSGSDPCLVAMVVEYARVLRPLEGRPLFRQPLCPITRQDLRDTLRELAELVGVDPQRLVPHCLRYGAVVSMLAHGADRDQIRLRGGWLAESGPVSYFRQSVEAARRAAAAVYDERAGRVEELVGLYSAASDAVRSSRAVALLRSALASPDEPAAPTISALNGDRVYTPVLPRRLLPDA